MSSPRPKTTKSGAATDGVVATYKHRAKRKNIPPSGIEAHSKTLREPAPKARFEYNPHLPPSLRFSNDPAGTDELPELLQTARQRPLTADEARQLAEALRKHEPWLEWSGKREKPWFEVDPVALHMHERVSTQAILRVLAREDVQRSLFADPQQEYAQAVQFYKHDVDWANRLILGDSLQVMASLARREDLAGKVQMIYLDPPYGIKFASNFQPQLGQRDVKDREQDLTREPEMVKAYRDTWTLGTHSYLAYLRDRLAMARELLADTGSIFVQISDENLHRVRTVMDEVFGHDNFCGLIPFATTGGQSSDLMSNVFDFLIWFARNREQVKYRQLFVEKGIREGGGWAHSRAELPGGTRHNLGVEEVKRRLALGESLRPYSQDGIASQGPTATGSAPFEFQGREFSCSANSHWKTTTEGMKRLARASRIEASENSLRFVRFLDDFPVQPIVNLWEDTNRAGYIDEKQYVVQTSAKVIERCLLMTTDPGDLVLDPTCGSGTTAYVAEQWGRRWITIDTSRVALALARQRLMTARFAMYRLRPLNAEDVARNPKGTWLSPAMGDGASTADKHTFQCKSVPHITLKSIARNAALDPIFARHEPILAERLKALNAALQRVAPDLRTRLQRKLAEKQRREGKKAVTDADRRRWELPRSAWQAWEAPFDTDPDWPQPLQDALTAYRAAWRAKMDEVNACIAANADSEELVDKPDEVRGVVRVSGPFTVEGVIALEEGPDSPIGGAPGEDLDTFEAQPGELDVANAEAHLDKMLRLLRASGVDFRDNKRLAFARLEPLSGVSLLHAEGAWANGDGQERRVAVSIGPQVGNMSAYQVEQVIRAANRRGYDDLVLAAFGFDAAAQDILEDDPNPDLRCHMALIRPDVVMEDLLKTQPGSQIFTVFSAPRATLRGPDAEGGYEVEVEGMDVYDPVTNTLHPTDKDRMAAWFLDSDYDGRTFCITQAFFPDKAKWQKLAKALGDTGVVEEAAFEALSGTRSLPFPRPANKPEGEPWRVAVKVIDPRGNEGMRVLTIEH